MRIEKKKSKEEKRNEEKNMFYGTSIKARLVCHTTAKFIYLIQTNGSFRKLVKYPPRTVLLLPAVLAKAIVSFLRSTCYILCYHALLSYDFISDVFTFPHVLLWFKSFRRFRVYLAYSWTCTVKLKTNTQFSSYKAKRFGSLVSRSLWVEMLVVQCDTGLRVHDINVLI